MRPFGPGARLGDGLEVLAHIARSNVIDVYDAWSQTRGARVAVKALRPDRLADGTARAALLAEGRLLGRLTHPHLVRSYEVRAGERPLVVLETLRGATLARLISERPLSAAETANMGVQVGSALRYLNGEGLVHLDLKPSNVIADAGAAKLIDLSIARRPGIVKAGTGTWCNLSPEQARGEFAGPKADVWGLGTVLFEAFTGVAPFDGEDDEGDFPCLDRRADPVRRHRPRAPRALAEAIDSALEPDPLGRPEIEELLAVLDDLAGNPAGPGRWPVGAPKRVPPAAPGVSGRTARARRTRPRAGR